jgi:hypothetical protein
VHEIAALQRARILRLRLRHDVRQFDTCLPNDVRYTRDTLRDVM